MFSFFSFKRGFWRTHIQKPNEERTPADKSLLSWKYVRHADPSEV